MSNFGKQLADYNSYLSGNQITMSGRGQLATVAHTNPQITNQKAVPGNVMQKNADGSWTLVLTAGTPKTSLGGNIMKKNLDGTWSLVA